MPPKNKFEQEFPLVIGVMLTWRMPTPTRTSVKQYVDPHPTGGRHNNNNNNNNNSQKYKYKNHQICY